MLSQGVVAGSSLVLQIVASRELGGDGLGRFSLLLAVLITLNSVQTGWIGDSLTVLDRFDPSLRRGLFTSQAVALAVIGTLCATVAYLVDGGRTAIAFGIAGMLWALEETGRRLLIARSSFWALLANDLVYAAGAIGYLLLAVLAGVELSLFVLVMAMAAGSLAAILAALTQLPDYELALPQWGPPELDQVARFGFWRAAQVGLRPGSQAAVRSVVILVAGAAALGQLEGARLLLAPLLTVANGAGVYLLPTYTNAIRQRRPFRPPVKLAMLALAGMCALYTLAAVAAADTLVPLLTNDGYEVSTTAIVAWGVFTAGFAAGIPAGNAVVASGRSGLAFRLRLVDAGVGVVLGGLLAMLSLTDYVPIGLGVGALVGAVLLLRAQEDPTAEATASGGMPRGDTSWTRPVAVAVPAVRRDVRRYRHRTAARTAGALWWLPLVLIVATDFKFRRRLNDDALSGSLDLFVLLELVVYGGVAAYLAFRPTQRAKWYPVVVMLTCYCLVTAASAIYAPFPTLAMARAVQLVILCYLVVTWISAVDLAVVRRFMHAYIALITVSILIGLAWVAPTTRRQEGRFTWLYTHSVIASSLMTVSSVLLFGLWLASSRGKLAWPRWVYGALTVLHIVSVLRSQTRGSIGAVAIAIGLMALMWSRGRARRDLLLTFGLAAMFVGFVFGGTILEFLTRGESAAKLASFNRRTEIWSLAFDRFLERPLHGLGFTAGRGVFFKDTGLGGAHNAYINVIIDTGLVGFVFWAGVICATVAALVRGSAHRRRRGQGASFDEIAIAGLVVALLINAVTTEGLGGGVSGLVVILFVIGGWATLFEREAERWTEEAPEPIGEPEPLPSLRDMFPDFDDRPVAVPAAAEAPSGPFLPPRLPAPGAARAMPLPPPDLRR